MCFRLDPHPFGKTEIIKIELQGEANVKQIIGGGVRLVHRSTKSNEKLLCLMCQQQSKRNSFLSTSLRKGFGEFANA